MDFCNFLHWLQNHAYCNVKRSFSGTGEVEKGIKNVMSFIDSTGDDDVLKIEVKSKLNDLIRVRNQY